jgi:hypothetical protein
VLTVHDGHEAEAEAFDSPFVLSLSKDERLTGLSRGERRIAAQSPCPRATRPGSSVPAPLADLTERVPPEDSVRSFMLASPYPLSLPSCWKPVPLSLIVRSNEKKI